MAESGRGSGGLSVGWRPSGLWRRGRRPRNRVRPRARSTRVVLIRHVSSVFPDGPCSKMR